MWVLVLIINQAAETIPKDLIDQLAPGGRMMIPVGAKSNIQFIYIVDKDMTGNVKEKPVVPVRYVPLTSKEKQVSDL
jgi:protein-L-isoaspartate(D-aspartate) O-methyltransferase